MEQVRLKVDGMTCGGCVQSVTRVLKALPGVSSVEVSLEKSEAALSYDAAKVGPAQFKAAIEDAGFEV